MNASTLTGTGMLVRLTLRRDRVRVLVWFAALIALPLVAVESLGSLYPTPTTLDGYARTAASPAAIAMNGPGLGLHELGGVVVFETGGFTAIAVALCSIFLVGRNTRAEEDSGRIDLLRAAVVGRHARTAAALLVVASLHMSAGAVIAAGLGTQGLPWAGSVAFGATLTAIGVVFAAVTAVSAQLAADVRGTYALAGAVFGAAYLARAVGDIGGDGPSGALSWFSPVGWAQATRAFANERWWPLLLVAGATAVCVAGAFAAESRRDVGEGMLPSRPGPPTADRALTTRLGLVWRLQRGSAAGWTAGILLSTATLGAAADGTEAMLADNRELRSVLGASGIADLTDAFFRMTSLLLALAVSGYLVAAVLRARTEERTGRLEPLLAGAVSRHSAALAQLAVPAAVSAGLLAAGGIGAGGAYALVSGETGRLPGIVAAAIAPLPAVWLLGGIATALFGILPRAAALAWTAPVAAAVVSVLGPALRLPDVAVNLSPFEHTPALPGGDVAVAGPAALLTGALALGAAGVEAFRRRDLAVS